jgi:hypothetical protein
MRDRTLVERAADRIRMAGSASTEEGKKQMSRHERYLLFQIEDGRLMAWGLYDTYEAAKEQMVSAGLSAAWKIASVYHWSTEAKRSKRRA